jgi:hypothetical protein
MDHRTVRTLLVAQNVTQTAVGKVALPMQSISVFELGACLVTAARMKECP